MYSAWEKLKWFKLHLILLKFYRKNEKYMVFGSKNGKWLNNYGENSNVTWHMIDSILFQYFRFLFLFSVMYTWVLCVTFYVIR